VRKPDRAEDAKGHEVSTSSSSTGDAKMKRGMSGIPMWAAVLAILVWIATLAIMLLASDTDDKQWARMTYVFASVEAIAFSAAGALFGVSVQRERVKSAEDKAAASERDATNGKALAMVAIADGESVAAREAYSFAPDEPPPDVRQRYAALARQLFPDLP
jgi:hypothetical protein